MEGPICTSGAKSAVDGVKRNGVDGVDLGSSVDRSVAVAFEGEIQAMR